jgi:ferric-dicitrate binding protein FerR (iron transport regulator)
MSIARRALAAPVLLGLTARQALADRARIGEVAAVTGEARADYTGVQTRRLSAQDALLLNDTLSTGLAARLACRLEGGLEIRLGEKASLRIDATTLQGPRPGTLLRVFEGPLLVDRPPQPSASPLEVRLPWARIGVRGTRFFAGPLDGRRAVFVERGRVVVQAGGTTAELGPGEGVDQAEPGGPLGPVVRWGAPRIVRAMALVS